MKDLIGILDSGVGGVSVLQKAAELLPNENFIYFGDNANAPYGPRSADEIRMLSAKAVQHVLNAGCKLFASVHGYDLASLRTSKPNLLQCFEQVVVLGRPFGVPDVIQIEKLG